MAQTEEQKLQAELLGELNKSDVKVSGDKAAEMKDKIANDRGGARYLGIGVHEVYIEKVSLVKANSGTLGIRLDVENEDGKSDATFWLSEAALPYTIENVSRIVVHNTAEADKETARNHMSNVVSAKELFNIATEKLIGGVAYLSIKESETQTYTDKETGEIKPSMERNLTSWKPKESVAQATAAIMGGGTPASEDNKGKIPF